MKNLKLIVGEDTYTLHKVPTREFMVSQNEPYPFEHRCVYERATDMGTNTYIYKSIVFNGEFYGFEKQQNKNS